MDEDELTDVEIDIHTSDAGLAAIKMRWEEYESYDLHVHDTPKGPAIYEEFVMGDEAKCACVLRLHRDANLEDYGIIPELLLELCDLIPALTIKIKRMRDAERINAGIATAAVRSANAMGIRVVDWCRKQGIKIPDDVLYGPRPERQ